MNKKCPQCGIVKTASEFHKDSARKHGLSGRCKQCAIENRRAHYVKNREYYRDYGRYHREAKAEYYRETLRDYRERYPERIRANNMIGKEVAAKKRVPAKELKCENCGKQAEHYHHPDYSKPLNVVPLCQVCHRREHGIGDNTK